MTISQAQLASFKEVYLQQYGKSLSDDDAYEMASNLLGLYLTVYIHDHQEKEDDKSWYLE